MASRIRIGTRGSQLAQIQASRVRQALVGNDQIEICEISTEGDIDQATSLSKLGGKGVFVKSLEEALLNNKVDIAVHSLKDITSEQPEALIIAGCLHPEATEDAVILFGHQSLEVCPEGTQIATGSLRRKALLKELYPDIVPVDIRGNVHTRINKSKDSGYGGVMLSYVGLLRLGLEDQVTQVMQAESFIPAPGQGVIAIQCRKSDTQIQEKINAISDPKQTIISQVEQKILKGVGFDCGVPLGIRTVLEDDIFKLKVFLANRAMTKKIRKEYMFKKSSKDQHIQAITDELCHWIKVTI